MSTLELLALKALLSSAPALIKRIDPSTALKARLEAGSAQVNHETLQACLAVCKMIVAHILGEDPSSEQVNAFFQKVVDEPGFAHRAYRHLAEMQRSPSQHRRLFLASVLFGLPFTSLPDDERDRVDMVVERMIPADAELLMRIAEGQAPPVRLGAEGLGDWVFTGGSVVALVNETELRLVTPEYWKNSEFLPGATTDPALEADRTALATLISLNCVILGGVAIGGEFRHEQFTVKSIGPTPLGYLVVQALTEVRASMEARL